MKDTYILQPYQPEPKPMAPLKPAKVKCLGPGADHWFLRRTQAKFGLCERCQERLSRLSPRAMESPARDDRV